jgi:hypothetical protein
MYNFQDKSNMCNFCNFLPKFEFTNDILINFISIDLSPIVTKKKGGNLHLNHSIQTIVTFHNKFMIHTHNNNSFGSPILLLLTPSKLSQAITIIVGSSLLIVYESYSSS